MQIKEVLQTMKVSNARIRFHPSQNIKWYSNFIDNDFFIVDRDSLLKSLQNNSCNWPRLNSFHRLNLEWSKLSYL